MESPSHLQRVRCHCEHIAQRMGLDGVMIGAASRLHDAGMIEVAQSSSPLTAVELEVLERHPLAGHALLSRSGNAALDVAATIALTHHERFAGGGYPRGLAGEKIPIEGRIVAVADTFDALTTDRVYRPATSVESAAVNLRAERGQQLDPQVVDAFLDGLAEAAEVIRRHPMEQAGTVVRALDEEYLTLQSASAVLNINPSRLRRWSDDGRIETLRTAGGHRRFSREAVVLLADEIGTLPVVRPRDLPTQAIPSLAAAIAKLGPKLAVAAATGIYGVGPTGWFASADATRLLTVWADQLAVCCEHGEYLLAEDGTEALMRHASMRRVTLLERHQFLDRFGSLSLRLALRARPETDEIMAARQLFTALQQRQLFVTELSPHEH